MPGESIQIMLGELSTEEVMRTFDSLPIDYRLSVPYLARIEGLTTLKKVHAAMREASKELTEAVGGIPHHETSKHSRSAGK